MVPLFNGVHNVFSIKAEARTIETCRGKSAMLTLIFCAEDGDPLKTQDIYFAANAESNAYDIEFGINAAARQSYMEEV